MGRVALNPATMLSWEILTACIRKTFDFLRYRPLDLRQPPPRSGARQLPKAVAELLRPPQ
jgi:hypothetical protein